ncbi:hypothetical protein Btru_008912 [Bulinus truncatus]|nr:hypothetical protein Btru_008912 [Bulinus truncatus]
MAMSARKTDGLTDNDNHHKPEENFSTETLKDKNILRNAIEGDGSDDEPLLGSDHHGQSLVNEQDEGVTKENVRNLATALTVVSLAMMSFSIHTDAYSQWLYVEFEHMVLGANASLLNSTASNPCIKGSNQTSQWTKELDEAQSLTSRFNTYSILVSLIPALFTNLFLGIYSDRIGRRILFLAPLFGNLIRMVTSCVVAYWRLSVYWIYFGLAIVGLSGHIPALFMGIYVYTADNTGQKKSRSLGMVIAQSIINTCFALSHIAVGYFIQAEGYIWPMLASALLMLCAFIICVFFLRETLQTNKLKKKIKFLEGVKVVFSFYTSQSVDSRYRRSDFILLGLVFFLYATCIGVAIQSMFLMNEPFCWSSIKIGDVTTYQGLLSAFASLILMRALQRFLTDEIICILSLLSATGSRFFLAFAEYEWMIYTAYTIGMFELLLLPIIRAILSRMVPSTTRGSLFASVAVIEVATLAVAGAGFDALYSFTVSFWHGLTYFVIACCVMVAAVFMIVFTIAVRRRQSKVISLIVVEEVPTDS